MPGRFDTQDKKTVREVWNTPILRYLHDNHQIKYRYLGLPGVDLSDIKLWRDMIEEVVAFELPDRGLNERESIVQLKRNLELVLVKVPSKVYYGSMEQVIILREDIDGSKYSQTKLITLYNLDFCDEITSKIPTKAGEKCLRFELIRQLLTDQHECYRINSELNIFIMLLTARNQTSSDFMKSYLFDEDGLDTTTHNFVEEANKVRPIPTENISLIKEYGWALKAFIYNTIRSYLAAPHLTCLLFPMVKYTGRPVSKTIASPMMHWMFLCKFEDPQLPRARVYPKNFLLKSSLAVADKIVSMSKGPGEVHDSKVDPLAIFKEYEKYFFS
jgi:hypothetical protein